MATEEVKSAEQAIEIARSFIKKYFTLAQPIKAVREDDVWLVDIDIGVLSTKIAKIKVDAKTSAILEYSIPPSSILP